MLHFSHICTLLESLVYENKMTFMISKVEKEWNNLYELSVFEMYSETCLIQTTKKLN